MISDYMTFMWRHRNDILVRCHLNVVIVIGIHICKLIVTTVVLSWPYVQFSVATANAISIRLPWWRHQMETFSAILVICAGNSTVTGEFPAQRPVTRSFDVFLDLRLNERLSKQSWSWWLRRHRAHYDVTAMRLEVQYLLIWASFYVLSW